VTRVAMPIWNDRISPVFDCARRLVVFERGESDHMVKSDVALDDVPVPCRGLELARLGVNVLICGAITRSLAAALDASGVTVIPFVSGEIEEVLRAYENGQLVQGTFDMPGCRGRMRKGKCGGRSKRGMRQEMMRGDK